MPHTLGSRARAGRARSGRVGETPVKQPTVTIFKNADDTWTAKIGTDTFVGTEEECIAWLDNELAAIFPDEPLTSLSGTYRPS